MQRLCVTLCGLLASCLCSWASSPFFVSQSPSTVTLKKGKELHLTCSWNISINRAKVKWFKDGQQLQMNKSDKFTENNNNNCATFVIKTTDRNDTGFYFCEITQDIPQLVMVKGTGTNVTYERENESGTCMTMCKFTTEMQITAQPDGNTMTLGASVSGAVVILSVCVCLTVWRRKRGCRQSERMVIKEGPPSEGEEPENSEDGQSSGASRGSTQWYMVPVYESYFDLQRCDDQQGADSDNATCTSAVKG